MKRANHTVTTVSCIASDQRGVALLTILLLVVSITVVAGAMLASQKMAIRQSGLLFEQDQLLQDLQAGQQLAVALIEADSKLNDFDSQQDIWAQPIPPYPVGTHTLKIEIHDDASRFNLNNLYHDGAVDEAALTTFKRLLVNLGLEESLALAVLDWQDPDATVFEDSANESTVYQFTQGATSSVTIPNQAFLTPDQLSDVPGMTPEAVATLRPLVTAVPYYLPVNVNSAVPEVVAAMLKDTPATQLQAFSAMRESQTVETLDDLWQIAPFNSLSEEDRKAISSQIDVESRAFTALISASDADKQRYATVRISKLPPPKESPPKGTGETQSVTPTGNEKTKVIRAFSQRLWPFRPSLG